MMNQSGLDEGAVNILGEILWHSATSDDTILGVSESHTHEVLHQADTHLGQQPATGPLRFLEVAAYAHITGYMLFRQRGWRCTVSDISVETLALGAKHAADAGLDVEAVRRVASDFHQLPFDSATFDVVYISSALHHTLRWKTVLEELIRVTARGGILIMQNEPCKREFCFYKFSTNRPHDFRPIEKLLEQQGILKTVAEPYIGSRPESLFGMIENQKMPVSEILHTLSEECTILSLGIQSDACLSDFDRAILAEPRDRSELSKMIERGLVERVRQAGLILDSTDFALGIKLPTHSEITRMANDVATRILALPPAGESEDPVALAAIFGGALTAVMRKNAGPDRTAELGEYRYNNGVKKGVVIGYPDRLAAVLSWAQDLVPDIQVAERDDIERHFAPDEWLMHGNADLKYLILRGPVGRIVLRPLETDGVFVVLLRVYANPVNFPFRLELVAQDTVIAMVDVYQQESFLLRGELPRLASVPSLALRVCDLDGAVVEGTVPVTVPAVRVVCISDGAR